MFNIDDKVKVVDDELKGKIIRIHKNRITILDEYGFEQTYNSSELIPDLFMEVDSIIISTEDKPQKPTKKKIENDTKEVDIHFGQLVDSEKNIDNYEKLRIQLAKIDEEMGLALAQKRKKLIFIHGHGSGKLRGEMMKLLKKYKGIKIYDASFRKYNGGATVVEF